MLVDTLPVTRRLEGEIRTLSATTLRPNSASVNQGSQGPNDNTVFNTSTLDNSQSSQELMSILLKQSDNIQAPTLNTDEDNESVISDYSEIGDAIKDHLTTSFSEGELKLIGKFELSTGEFQAIPTSSAETNKIEEETEEAYAKRMKKINYLSLAQEFAALKAKDADALPLGLTRTGFSNRERNDTAESDEDESVLDGAGSDDEVNSTCGDANSHTESAQPTPMDISQENADDSLSCPESDSLLPLHPEDSMIESNQDESSVLKDLATLSIDVVEAWHISGPGEDPGSANVLQDADGGEAKDTDYAQISLSSTNMTKPLFSNGDKTVGDTDVAKTVSNLEKKAKTTQEIHDKLVQNAKTESEKEPGITESETGVTPLSPTGAFDVFSAESLAPPALADMDWSLLERQLEQAAEEEARRKASKGSNDREEIRRRLAMGCDDDDDFYYGERVGRKPKLGTRLQSNMNLQICFMNEDSETIEIADVGSTGGGEFGESSEITEAGMGAAPEAADQWANCQLQQMPLQQRRRSEPRCDESTLQQPQQLQQRAMTTSKSVGHFLHCLLPGGASKTSTAQPETEEDFETRQARLRLEAQKALAQAQPMAHMQIEFEKMQRNNKSPIQEIMNHHGIHMIDPDRKLTRRDMERDMNLAQLQVIFNDLRTRIDNHSQELVRLLEERDDLHMEQDSMLVDIDDLTRRLKDMAEKSKKVQVHDGGRRSKKTPLKQFNDWLTGK